MHLVRGGGEWSTNVEWSTRFQIYKFCCNTFFKVQQFHISILQHTSVWYNHYLKSLFCYICFFDIKVFDIHWRCKLYEYHGINFHTMHISYKLILVIQTSLVFIDCDRPCFRYTISGYIGLETYTFLIGAILDIHILDMCYFGHTFFWYTNYRNCNLLDTHTLMTYSYGRNTILMVSASFDKSILTL